MDQNGSQGREELHSDNQGDEMSKGYQTSGERLTYTIYTSGISSYQKL